MLRKTLLFSVSAFCLSQFSGMAIAAHLAPVISAPLAAARPASPLILAKAEGTAGAAKSTVKSAAEAMGKKAKAAKKTASASAKAAEKKTLKPAKEAKSAKMKAESAGKAVKDKAAGKTAKTAAAGKKTASAPAKTHRRKGSYETTLARKNREDARDFRQSAGENCVCTNGFYCVGPRGGHYCYTSGGNKRYLKRY